MYMHQTCTLALMPALKSWSVELNLDHFMKYQITSPGKTLIVENLLFLIPCSMQKVLFKCIMLIQISQSSLPVLLKINTFHFISFIDFTGRKTNKYNITKNRLQNRNKRSTPVGLQKK